MKPVIRRAAADHDVQDIVDHYLAEAGPNVALEFIETLERAYEHLSRQPATGSPRLGMELGVPGLRSWPLRRFPCVVFYFEHQDFLEAWRVLHGRRDIPVHLQAPDEG